ncbi:uncharacterized protein LOC108737290 [Agrilus planipennis]|uniref:Uncharacterized protein LOC108737290 n=1 Tax=Agrilus planipennis TaxID=224129 RepID=A0A1W4WZH0_AGRPL|nr:uncharacterized protein LOC108737290 [Agrilus planipennis]
MPSAEVHAMSNSTTNNINTAPLKSPEFNISSKEVEGLVMEIKENLRLSATTFKAIPCSHLSRKSSRASPYRIPTKICSCNPGLCDSMCVKKNRRKQQIESNQDDPYEFLQKLLRDGSLVNEAVRRVQLGLTPKQRYFYESDEESSPVLHLYPGN